MLDKISVANEYKRQQAISSVYLALAKTCSADFSFEMVLDVIIQSVYKLVEAEYVSIFLCDHHRRELTLIASKDGFQGLTIDFGQGIAGYVASTAKAVCIADAYTDTRFDQKMDKVAQHRTKSMLCVPILGFGSTQDVAIAVIQAMNKEGKPHFVPQDESVLVNVAAEISKTFKTRIVDVKYLSSSAAREDDLYLEEGLYKEYGSTIQKRFRIGEDLQLESLNHDAFSSLVKDEGPDNLPATPKAHRSKTFYNDALRVNTWDIDPFLLEEDEMIRLLLHMLYSFGVDDILKISKDRLVAFLGAVKGKYRSSNAFHNSRHAFGVMHISFMILSLGAAKYLTPLEAITVLIAAYCHDLDHPGNTKYVYYSL
jgi:3',5'-cyclic-nucleotide phosphodiesterase